jgi:hypothetical protein
MAFREAVPSYEDGLRELPLEVADTVAEAEPPPFAIPVRPSARVTPLRRASPADGCSLGEPIPPADDPVERPIPPVGDPVE